MVYIAEKVFGGKLIDIVVDYIIGKVSFISGAPRALRSELHSKIV